MSGLKSGMIVLLLAVPFVVYGVFQVQAAAQSDLIADDPPSDKGLPTKEQLAAAKIKAEKWAGDVREVSAVALQFRAAVAVDPAADKECTALAKLVAARSADLTDLEKFLSGVDRPVYVGGLKDRYTEWQANKAKLAKAEDAIDNWLKGALPGTMDSAAAANQAMKGFADLVADYKRDSKFADAGKADAWQVEARVKVIRSLEEAAKKPYAAVLELPLPLPSAVKNKLVEQALGAPAAIREQARMLRDDLSRAEERKAVSPRVEKLAREILAVADEWAAKEELLGLFADPELFTDPNKAAEWLPKVQTQLNKTQTDAGRELIRKKVQQFCDAYIPRVTRLDEVVLIQGKAEPRNGVTIEYDSDAKVQPLTDRLERLNEFTFPTAFKNFDRIVWAGGNKFTGTKSALQPTPKSVAAREFTLARATVTTWSSATVNQLKMKCEGEGEAVKQQERRDQTDELVGTAPDEAGGTAWTKQNTKIWTRLSALSAAMAKYPALFEDKP